VLDSPDVKANLEKQGLELTPGPPEALSARISTDIAKWREVIESIGLRKE